MRLLAVLIAILMVRGSEANKFKDMPAEKRRKYLGMLKDPEIEAAKAAARASGKSTASTDILPANFTVSDKWPVCASVFNVIQNQAECGACWAVSTASVLTDRRCIVFGKPKPAISAWNLASCCRACTGGSPNGCNGGFPAKAFRYFKKKGIVTGDTYGSKIGCQPYKIDPNVTVEQITSCKKKCRKGYKRSPKKAYKKDKKYGKSVKIFSLDNTAVMNEIYKNGPVVASFAVYMDFYDYAGGIYKRYSNVQDGYHAVRVVGWGVTSNGTKYWRVANSWGTDWGELGFFNILRDTNECEFEEGFVSGKVKKK